VLSVNERGGKGEKGGGGGGEGGVRHLLCYAQGG